MTSSDFAQYLRDLARESATGIPGASVFAEEPVSLTVFVQDRQFLANPPLSPVQYDAVRHIERIYYNGLFHQPDGELLYLPERDTYKLLADEFESGKKPGTLHVGSASAWRDEKYWAEPVRMINFATLQWGKGSGKDHICRVASMRIAYLLMCLNSPQDYYRLPEQDTIHLLNVASSSAQAQQAFFMPIVRAVKRGWFAHRCVPRQNVISFAKNVEAVSGHSEAESQEGLNLLLGIADEIDAFKSKKEMAVRRGGSAREPTKSAEGILNMMRSSSATRFPETFKQVRISYPRYLGSTIQTLTADAKNDIKVNGKRSRHYVSGPLATWVVNPRVPGREAFAGDYKDDPVMARSKYECKPARAINPYFRNQQAVDACFKVHKHMPLLVDYRTERLGNAVVWVPNYHFADDFHPVRGAVYAMHGDLSIKGDRAGIAMAHVARYSEHPKPVADEDGAIYQVNESRPNVKVDFVISFTSDASADPPREIQIRWARQLCFELIKRGFNVRRFSFDTFQCMSGDTEIPLLDGTTRKLRELEGAAPFWLYSIKDGRVVPGLCTKAWRTGLREDMVEVELDNGETVRTTSDHRFMLRDGTYRRADGLRSGDSLMPLYRRTKRVSPTSREYEQIWHPEPDGSGKRWRFTHSMVSHYCYGKLPKGWVTHHKNLDALDNRPENLEQMTNQAHKDLHHRLTPPSAFRDAWADPVWRERHRQRLSAHLSAVQTGKTREQSRRYRRDITIDTVMAMHRRCLSEGVTPTKVEVCRRLGCTQPLLYARVRDAGYRSWKAFRDAHETVSPQAMYQREWKRRQKIGNHTVVAVRPSAPEDVFDLQVEDHHNFAVSAGVFVHNSFDSMQILQAKNIESKKVSTDLTDEVYRNLRDVMYEGRVEIPRPEPTLTSSSFLLRDELLGLSRMPNGRIDHAATGSKDEADALGCAVLGAIELGGSEDATGERAHFAPPEFYVGRSFSMPTGANLRQVWERPGVEDITPHW